MEQNNTAESTQEKKFPNVPAQAGAADVWLSEKQKELLEQLSRFIPGVLVLLLLLRMLSSQLLPWALLLSAAGLAGLSRYAPARKLITIGLVLGVLGFLFFFQPNIIFPFYVFTISALFISEGILQISRVKKSAAPNYFRICGILSCVAGGLWALVSFVNDPRLHEFSVFMLFCAALQSLIISIVSKIPLREKESSCTVNRD